MKTRRFFVALYAFLMLFAIFPAQVFAAYNHINIDQPAAITVVTYNAPEDLEIRAEVQKDGEGLLMSMAYSRRIWEVSYRLYREDVFHTKTFRGNDKDFAGTVLLCRSGGVEQRIPIPQEYLTPGGKQDVMTLDCESWTLRTGVPDWRGPVSVAERLVLIVLVKALLFLLMKYRGLRSWLGFLGTNLATQIPLNVSMKNMMEVGDTAMHSKVFLGSLFVGLVLVLVIETMLMAIAVKEHNRDYTTIYVVGANVLGLITLIAALAWLPV
ncbi:MAG: hypothetical protein E7425_06075 [Ruminococcaceae bacterium]|jgi:hypothetical protein|nr:hypothetical protein [Oscillospiraceae bacterium]